LKIDSQLSNKVLVLGNDNNSFLSVIRSLGRKGICVHVGWCAPQLNALKSKYISKYHFIPQFSLTSLDWKISLTKIIEQEKYDLVIPCGDPEIIPLQLYKDEFDKFVNIYLLDNVCYNRANDKFIMQKLASDLGVNVPREIEITKSTDTKYILSEIPFPIVLKPRVSFSAENLAEKYYVEKVYTIEKLKYRLDQLKEREILIAQQNFIGNGVGVELLASDGIILYAFQHIRIHEPLTGGGSSYRKSLHLNPELLDASAKIIKALKYTGVAMVEFKMNLNNNEWMFIELNARFWGSLPLSIAAGADFPYFLYLMLTRGEKQFSEDYVKGVFCRNLTADMYWLFSNIRADKSNPTLCTMPLWRVAAEIINIISLKERNDTIVFDDINPGIAEIMDLTKKCTAKISREVNKLIIHSSIFRIVLHQKAVAAINKANIILFVCKGNIFRSPFAHHYLNSICRSNINVISCGYYPKEGRTPPSQAVAAAKNFGIDLTGHRSIIITHDLVQKADVVLTFDEDNFRTLLNQFPSAKSKIHRLSSIKICSSFEIEDPYEKDHNEVVAIYTRIKDMIEVIGHIIGSRTKL